MTAGSFYRGPARDRGRMGAHRLDCFFDPHRIALIGVTINPNSVGGKVLSNLVGGRYQGLVYPVNPDS